MVLRPNRFIFLFCLCSVWCFFFFFYKDKLHRSDCTPFHPPLLNSPLECRPRSKKPKSKTILWASAWVVTAGPFSLSKINLCGHSSKISYTFIFYIHSPKGLLGTPGNFSLMQLSNQPITWQLLQCI